MIVPTPMSKWYALVLLTAAIPPPLPASIGVQDDIQKKTDDAENKRRDKSLPEAGNVEPPDKVGRHIEEDGVDNEGKKSEGKNRHRQGEKDEDRPEKGVEKAQNKGCDEDGHPVVN